jgi:peptidoglycan hydrolase-like protein with peptidoglycan-binding domain
MTLTYRKAGLAKGSADHDLIKALQRDLRALGYLRQGIDGDFGDGTRLAVCRLQHDLLNNNGSSTSGDGNAPCAVRDFNNGRVSAIDGVVAPGLADCIADLLAADAYPKLPSAEDPHAANAAAVDQIRNNPSKIAPTPFMLAMFRQESNLQHYRVPAGANSDNFVTVGLDIKNPDEQNHVTSRGYGLGQFTIFHHPPHPAEVGDFIVNPVKNVEKAHKELREKFDKFVANLPPGGADDRHAEHPGEPLRLCKFSSSDPRFLRDCRDCAAQAPKLTIRADTPVIAGSAMKYGDQELYREYPLTGVPDRASFPCDWPYAARRYNGGGALSYNYQSRILRNLVT